jgi:hypothetical protein
MSESKSIGTEITESPNYLEPKSNFKLFDKRQKDAIERFIPSGCGFGENWGLLLLHKVGTGKTITSLLIALNDLISDESIQLIEIICVAPVGLFGNFNEDYLKITCDNITDCDKSFKTKQVKLIDYDYDTLINDVNSKNIRNEITTNLTNRIIIFDEAHRLLTKVIYNSIEANNAMEKHSLLEDTYFINTVYTAKHAILLTGTPLQKTSADLCMFSNFLTRTTNFDIVKYSSRTIDESSKIYLLRHWKWLIGLVPALATVTLQNVGHILPDEYKWLEPLVIYMLAAGITSKVANEYAKKVVGGKNIVGGMVFLQNLIGSVASPKKLIDDFYIDPTASELQLTVSELEEPTYDMVKLSKDMSPFISVYDYELQDSDCDNSPLNLKLNFPRQIVIEVRIEYDNDQLLLQYKSIVRPFDMLPIEKQILNINPFEKQTNDIMANAKEFKKKGKFVGNYSKDVLEYYAILDKSEPYKNTKYIVLNRDYTKIDLPTDNPFFKCNKFELIVLKLLWLKSKDTFPITGNKLPGGTKEKIITATFEGSDAETEAKYMATEILQPHSTATHRYLPLVYSYTEDYGIALFGAFLTSFGFKYILVHTSQKGIPINERYKVEYEEYLSPDDKKLLNTKIQTEKIKDLLDFNKFLAFEAMYEKTNESGPLCVLLDPTMTEGLNATYNPAMFILEPCNTFGDQEQVYGRVLRKYNLSGLVGDKTGNKYERQYPKMIYQYVMSENTANPSSSYLTKISKSLKDGGIITDLIHKSSYFRLSYNPTEYLKNSFKYMWQFPDEFYSKRIRKENNNLKAFEKSIEYGILCSDTTYNKECKKTKGGSRKLNRRRKNKYSKKVKY